MLTHASTQYLAYYCNNSYVHANALLLSCFFLIFALAKLRELGISR